MELNLRLYCQQTHFFITISQTEKSLTLDCMLYFALYVRILLYWYEIVIHYFETKFQNIVAVQKQLISEREAYSESRKNSKKKSGD